MRVPESAATSGLLPIMKFTLTFEGDLPASGNKPKPDAVWRIRKAIHPQLCELFATHPTSLRCPKGTSWR